jgi:hypothetical protein
MVRQAGIWQPIVNAYVRLSGVWTEFFQNFSAVAAPSSLAKFGTTAGITTAAATVTPSGGSAPYTYAWARHSGATAISADDPTLASSTFSAALSLGQRVDATFNCTVTDANGHAVIATVAVHIERIDYR